MSSRHTELLITVDRQAAEPMRTQLERQLRDAVRSGALRPGGELPSTRDLARHLGISRPLVMEAYTQLEAEGYVALRQGAAPRVADAAPQHHRPKFPPESFITAYYRYDFRPGIPDLSTFPSARWLKSVEAGLKAMGPNDFGYGQRFGVWPLRQALADYLGRVRGVSADPRQILITGGFEQARACLALALRRRNITHLAVEEPGYANYATWVANGLTLVPIPVDGDGIDVAALAASPAQAVLVTPAHQSPTGVVLSGARRLALVNWLRARNGFAIEDDYDGEFRYDRAPVGALQGLAPDAVVYAGTASKSLAPALRMGWMVVPPALLSALEYEALLMDYGQSRIDQHALAHFIASGEYGRHLRKMRAIYRDRREALLAAIRTDLPEVEVSGISAGLHATVRFHRRLDEPVIRERASRRDMGVTFLRRHYLGTAPEASTLLLSYAQMPERALRTALRTLVGLIEN
ncbi:MAG TPA: PLP-dependent aminotransferase family protein [Devosia sp.]|uniref:MocR-like pyridoxine biosynthesis transcription factor PdxR n=1 Tax=Devosia sp. TaxID=1871048 RepID=UPI002DDD4053|nr:PLP-dependent aminotransferase family protein [Devosia sp.]HEV2513954.1 PLP-dependent aminotransferase family protein [Devosia sp.]